MKILPEGIELSDSDIQVLKNDLLNVEDWVKGALAGKVNACKTRLLSEWTVRLMDDPSVDTIPSNEGDLISLITSNVNYKTRAEREIEDGSTIN